MRRKTLMVTAAVAALALAACGGGAGGGGDSGGGGTAAAGATLSMVDNAFEPATLTVGAGAQVEVTNDGELPHNITVEGSGIDEDVDPGAATSVAVDLDPGTYTMYCEFHRSGGMEGTVEVQ